VRDQREVSWVVGVDAVVDMVTRVAAGICDGQRVGRGVAEMLGYPANRPQLAGSSGRTAQLWSGAAG
jgi:hypothetical protein